MIAIVLWSVIYAIVVAASILLIGKPIEGGLQLKSLLSLLLDWRFIAGGILALVARFIFVIINNLSSKHPSLQHAHLTIAALATMGSIIAIIAFNALFLGEQLKSIQLVGAAIILFGIFLIFK